MSGFAWSPLLGGRLLLTSTSTLTLTLPSPVNGTVILAFVIRDTEVTCTSSAWTKIVDGLGASNILLDVYATPNNGLQGSSVSFESAVEQELHGGLLVTNDIPFTSVVEASATATFTSDTTPDSPNAASDDTVNNIWLCLWLASSAVTLTEPAGFTAISTSSSAAIPVSTALAAKQTGGSLGAATSSPASSGRAWTLVLNYEEPTVQTSTRQLIRDRMITLIKAITPTIRSDVKFRHSLDEREADFVAQMDANPAGALRRFQVRWDRATEVPEASSELETQTYATFVIMAAYPHTAATGSEWARDRDDAIETDWHAIDQLVGIYGRGNFSGTNTCVPLGATHTIVEGETCDFLRIEARVLFTLDVS